MRRIADKNLAELLMQLRFTPGLKRLRQIAAAEELICLIDPSRDYPWEFVHFKITGFKPAGQTQSYLIPGSQLLEDLRIFVTRLSTIAAPSVEDLSGDVYTIAQVARQLGISQKTVSRWRRQGLVVRRFLFGDGKKRLGVRGEVLQRFLQAHPDLVSRAARFSRLDEQDRQRIIDMATGLACEGASMGQIVRQVATNTGRARETVRYTLQAYLNARGTDALARARPSVLTSKDAQRLFELYSQGVRVGQLAARFGRSRSSIYRIVNQKKAMALLAGKIHFVPSPDFEDPDRRQQILEESVELPITQGQLAVGQDLGPDSQLLPDYLKMLNQFPPIGGHLETRLFRKYNCLKYMAAQCRARINLARPSAALLRQAQGYLAQAQAIEKVLIAANLRLVVGIARKHAQDQGQFMDLVSRGNYALITAIQEYDYTRGISLGKQAALTIAKEYAKASGRDIEISRKRAASIGSIQMQLRQSVDIGAVEQARRSLTEVIKRELDDRQQYVIINHFGLAGSGLRRKGKTLQEIGDHLGLSKERVRQIELMALQRLRQCLSAEEFELLTK